MVIPNAINIEMMNGDKIMLTSFVSRDRVYQLMTYLFDKFSASKAMQDTDEETTAETGQNLSEQSISSSPSSSTSSGSSGSANSMRVSSEEIVHLIKQFYGNNIGLTEDELAVAMRNNGDPVKSGSPPSATSLATTTAVVVASSSSLHKTPSSAKLSLPVTNGKASSPSSKTVNCDRELANISRAKIADENMDFSECEASENHVEETLSTSKQINGFKESVGESECLQFPLPAPKSITDSSSMVNNSCASSISSKSLMSTSTESHSKSEPNSVVGATSTSDQHNHKGKKEKTPKKTKKNIKRKSRFL